MAALGKVDRRVRRGMAIGSQDAVEMVKYTVSDDGKNGQI